jgi:magnesium-protoporphyrin IX monomethyl ester (oxidative) cyclase
MQDFHISLDLAKLTKTREYTFFPVEWIVYAVYLSEKIGYWRYILIYRHLEQHPEHSFYPLFNYFESWCQDENRHGDIFKALVRSQPSMWQTWQGRLWSRFFLLSVFATHSMTVHERAKFYEMLGLDATKFDAEVVRKTNDTAARAFPVYLNVDHPEFFPRLERAAARNLKIKQLMESSAPTWVKKLRQLPLVLGIVGDLLRLYLIQPLNAEALRGTVR